MEDDYPLGYFELWFGVFVLVIAVAVAAAAILTMIFFPPTDWSFYFRILAWIGLSIFGPVLLCGVLYVAIVELPKEFRQRREWDEGGRSLYV